MPPPFQLHFKAYFGIPFVSTESYHAIFHSFIVAVKRLMREAMELKEATSDYFAQPLSDNLFEWHFTVRGPCDTEFEGGVYHGRIILPTDYPMKPPHIMVLTVSRQNSKSS